MHRSKTRKANDHKAEEEARWIEQVWHGLRACELVRGPFPSLQARMDCVLLPDGSWMTSGVLPIKGIQTIEPSVFARMRHEQVEYLVDEKGDYELVLWPETAAGSRTHWYFIRKSELCKSVAMLREPLQPPCFTSGAQLTESALRPVRKISFPVHEGFSRPGKRGDAAVGLTNPILLPGEHKGELMAMALHPSDRLVFSPALIDWLQQFSRNACVAHPLLALQQKTKPFDTIDMVWLGEETGWIVILTCIYDCSLAYIWPVLSSHLFVMKLDAPSQFTPIGKYLYCHEDSIALAFVRSPHGEFSIRSFEAWISETLTAPRPARAGPASSANTPEDGKDGKSKSESDLEAAYREWAAQTDSNESGSSTSVQNERALRPSESLETDLSRGRFWKLPTCGWVKYYVGRTERYTLASESLLAYRESMLEMQDTWLVMTRAKLAAHALASYLPKECANLCLSWLLPQESPDLAPVAYQ
jgi:hypothetical protein